MQQQTALRSGRLAAEDQASLTSFCRETAVLRGSSLTGALRARLVTRSHEIDGAFPSPAQRAPRQQAVFGM